MAALACPAVIDGQAAMTEAQMREVAVQDMQSVYGVPVAWRSAEQLAIVAFTSDTALAVLAADQFCRAELGDGYPMIVGGVVVEDPVEVVLLGRPGDELAWRVAEPDDDTALSLCVVRPAKAVRPC
jgi:hypothetical protein